MKYDINTVSSFKVVLSIILKLKGSDASMYAVWLLTQLTIFENMTLLKDRKPWFLSFIKKAIPLAQKGHCT